MRILGTILLATLLAAVAAPAARAEDQTCCTASQAAGLTEPEIRLAISTKVRRLLRNGHFDELEAMASQFRDAEQRTSSGTWMLSIFYGIDPDMSGSELLEWDAPADIAMQGLDDWKVFDRLIGMWLAAYPKSPTPHIMYAAGLYQQAMEKRRHFTAGSNYTMADLAIYPGYLFQAREHLEQHRDLAEQDVHWYAARAIIGKELGETFDEIMRYASAGIEQEPYYYELWFVLARTFFPNRGGDWAGFEAFVNNAIEATREEDGDALYARLYWVAFDEQWGRRMFESRLVDWTRMTAGMKDVVARYPDQWNIQHFANFSCYAVDFKAARTFFDAIDGPVIEEAWDGGKKIHDACREIVYSDG